MDPSWSECPYCKNAGATSVPASARPRTMMESDSAVPLRRDEVPAGGPAPVLPPMVRAKRSGTKFMTEGQETPTLDGLARPHPVAVRKIVALLATYSWKPEGEIFPVFEGRNLIGSAPECEVSIGSDPQMSGKHATLIFRSGTYLLDDASSMNGTFLEEEDVVEKVRLSNYAHIRTGATQWIFILINPEENALSR